MSVAAPPKHACVRCGRVAARAARTPNGGICKPCYRKDPARMELCAGCGRLRAPSSRRPDGQSLCNNCARPRHLCASCGRLDHAKSMSAEGPLCQRCYTAPQRVCGKCGQTRRIAVRAQRGAVDLCHSCAQTPDARCELCSEIQPVHTRWPLGAVCMPCYRRATKTLASCAMCASIKILIGRNEDGDLVCGPCVNSSTDYVCATCGEAGAQHYQDTCLRCSIKRLSRELLTLGPGEIRPELAVLPDRLASRGEPASTMRWLMKPANQAALKAIAVGTGPLDHSDVDACRLGHARHYLRALLVESGVLAPRDEPIERLETWTDDFLAGLPHRHAVVIEPYGRWAVLRGARRRARRGGFTIAAADGARDRIRLAWKLAQHLESLGLQVSDLSQAVLDDWTAGDIERTRTIAGFIGWLNTRGIVENVRLELPKRPLPSEISAEVDHTTRIVNLLDDSCDAELGTRVAGLLLLVYGARISQMHGLTTAAIDGDDQGMTLALAQHPIELPGPLAALVKRLVQEVNENPRARTPDGGAFYLFPGARPYEPIHPTTLGRKLGEAGIPPRISRNYAMVALTTDLPAAVVATQLGLSASATNRWAKFGQRDRTEYLLARRETSMTSGHLTQGHVANG